MTRLDSRIVYSIPVWVLQTEARDILNRELTRKELEHVRRFINTSSVVKNALEMTPKYTALLERNKNARIQQIHYAVYRKISIAADYCYEKIFISLNENDAREYVSFQGEAGDYQFKIIKVIKGMKIDVVVIVQKNDYSDL